MKRCPSCQSIYTDDSLAFCLQDGTRLVSDSSLPDDVTLQMRKGAEPPPTEIMRPEDLPTARIEGTSSTIGQQRARPTARDGAQAPATNTVAPRSNATVIALSAIAALLLVALGGLMTWIMMRDRGQQTQTRTATSNQEGTTTSNTTERRNVSNTNSTANATPQGSPVDVSSLQKEVQTTLSAWADTVRRRNLDEHMSYYADVLEVYYNAANVSRERVRADRSVAFAKYTSLDMQLTNMSITIEPSGTHATATFDKTFDFRNDEKSFNGSGLNRFWLVKTGGRWKITGEKDLKTYYVNK